MEYDGGAWSPYLVGALIGLLTMATFYLSDKPLGVSTAYARLAGLAGNAVSPRHTGSLKLFKDSKPKIDWEVMLLFGIVIGAFLAAMSGGELSGTWVPALWADRFGAQAVPRLAIAFIGGGVMAYGARLAGGCTSGHGISGALQLSLSSWIAMACFFMAAAAVSLTMYRL